MTQADIFIDQNANKTFTLQINQLTNPGFPWDAISNPYLPIDITNCTFEFNAGPNYVDPPWITASSALGSIKNISPTTGAAAMYLVPADTASLDFGSDPSVGELDGVYDIYMTNNTGPIVGYSNTNGSGYNNGIYNNVPMYGGAGTGAQARLTVSGGGVSAYLTVAGNGYVAGDVLTTPAGFDGVGAGVGFSLIVTSITSTVTRIFYGAFTVNREVE